MDEDSGQAFWARSNEAILADFAAHGGQARAATAVDQRQWLRAALRRDAVVRGEELPLVVLGTDAQRCAEFLRRDQRLRGPGRIARSTAARLRYALRALFAWAPPPPGCRRRDVRAVLVAGQRGASAAVGVQLRTVAGVRLPRRRREPPTREQIAAVIDAVAALVSPFGREAAACLAFMAATGSRLGATLALTVADLRHGPGQPTHVLIHEKARPERRPVLLPGGLDAALPARWESAEPDRQLWSDADGRALTARVLRDRLQRGCDAIGVRLVPHDVRRSFATDVSRRLGFAAAQAAGGWLSRATVERYVRPRGLQDG